MSKLNVNRQVELSENKKRNKPLVNGVLLKSSPSTSGMKRVNRTRHPNKPRLHKQLMQETQKCILKHHLQKVKKRHKKRVVHNVIKHKAKMKQLRRDGIVRKQQLHL